MQRRAYTEDLGRLVNHFVIPCKTGKDGALKVGLRRTSGVLHITSRCVYSCRMHSARKYFRTSKCLHNYTKVRQL